MNLTTLPLFELTLLLPLVGAVAIAFVKATLTAARWCMSFSIGTFACALVASFEFVGSTGSETHLLDAFFLDRLSAPMLPMMAMLHLLTMLGTSKSRVSIQFCIQLLMATFVSLAIVTCHSIIGMCVLLMIEICLPTWDLASRQQRLRGFLLYMLVFASLLLVGVLATVVQSSEWAVGFVLLSLLLRGGIFPLHGWHPALVQGASFGTAILFVLPLVEVVAAIRLVLPIAPIWMLQTASIACLITAVYCGGLAIIQHDVRRFFAHLCLSQTSLVLFAVMLATPSSLTAALCLWISSMIALTGLGFSIRALEARFGELSLRQHHGYYEQVPGLAVCFFVTGLAAVGFPGTVGFIPMELLISGSMDQGLGISVTLAVAAMFNGLAIMRAYFALFTGKRPTTSISLQVTSIERVAIVTVALLVFLGGWFSPSVVESRHRVAEELLKDHSKSDNFR
ncbi:MAG: proton-conducting transporter membrane subunit [Pirellula sp.]